jgi:putative nucleotidyltransferase with HDIG domain
MMSRSGIEQSPAVGRAWDAAAGANAHLRRRGRLAAFMAVGFSAAFAFWLAAGVPQVHCLRSAAEAGVVAATAVILVAAVLYFISQPHRGWRFDTTPLVARQSVDLFMVLGKLTELRDPKTASHTLRVAFYTLMFSEALGLPASSIVRAVKGALLHDIGKIAIPDHILNKPGRLTVEEWATMQTHVANGLAVIARSAVLAEAAPVVAAHHERYDGKGYPLGLGGEVIPYEARLFVLVDVFDALTSIRPYKRAFVIEEALAIMSRERGSHFDPVLFDRFIELAPNLASQLPEQEAALTTLLMDRLEPYLDHFIFVEPTPAGSPLNCSRSNSYHDKTLTRTPPPQRA